MFIASNWDKVRKMNKDGSLDSLGVSAIRKRLKPKAKPDAPTSAGNVSKGKAKPEAEASDGPSITKTEAKPTTAEDLVKFVKAQMKEHGITEEAFNNVWFEGVYPQG
jgi:hypothetical protein